MAVATFEDVAVAIGRPISSDEQARVNYWLDAAEIQIKARLGNVTALDQAVVRYVETEAVAARMLNPEGYQSESIDDYTFRLPSESRQVTIRDEWWRLLSPARSGSFYTIPVSSPLDLP